MAECQLLISDFLNVEFLSWAKKAMNALSAIDPSDSISDYTCRIRVLRCKKYLGLLSERLNPIELNDFFNAQIVDSVDRDSRRTLSSPIKADKIQCVCCSDVGVEYHHIIPHSMGGKTIARNLVPLCHDCHVTIEMFSWSILEINRQWKKNLITAT